MKRLATLFVKDRPAAFGEAPHCPLSALPVTKGPINRIARHAQPARSLADVVACLGIGGQHMRALNFVQIMFDPVVI